MSELKLPADSGGGSVSLKGPASTTGNADVPFVLPVADGSAGEFLKTDGSKNLSFAAAGGTNTPAWSVGLSSNFGTTDGTYVKIPFDSEEFDTDSAFASNKFTVPSGKAGKYMVMYHFRWSGAEDNEVHYAALYKNGSILNTTIRHEDTGDGGNALTFNYAGLHDLAVGDYLEVYFKDGDSGESNSVVAGYARFQGFKLL